MAFIVEERIFKGPADDECLVRRLGSAVIAVWPSLPEEIRAKILSQAHFVWDREYHVPRLADRLEAIIRRYQPQLNSRPRKTALLTLSLSKGEG